MDSVWIPLGAAMLDWLAITTQNRRLQRFTGPAVMLAALAWFLIDGPGAALPAGFFLAGALCSLAAEVLLHPAVERFEPALIAYSAAYFLYTIGLLVPLPPVNASTFLFAAVVALLTVRLARRIGGSLAAGAGERLPRILRVHTILLSAMLFGGLSTLANDAWSPAAAVLAAAGSVLFAISNFTLVWDRFVEPVPRAQLKVRVPRELGQILLLAGAIAFALQ